MQKSLKIYSEEDAIKKIRNINPENKKYFFQGKKC